MKNYVKYRLDTVRDILTCGGECSREAYEKILDIWTGEHIRSLEDSKAVSGLKTEETTLLNRIYGSSATCHRINDTVLQKDLLKLMPYDLFRNFRRAAYNRKFGVTVEDWIWTEDDVEFTEELDLELTCLEGVLVSYLVYLLGGFTAPRDNLKYKMDRWVDVDVSGVFSRPRDLFLLTGLSPAILIRFLYWKLTAVLMGFMRHFSSDASKDVEFVRKRLAQEGYLDAP